MLKKVLQWYLNISKDLKKTIVLSLGFFKIKLTLFQYKTVWSRSKNTRFKFSANNYPKPRICTGNCARFQSLGQPQFSTVISVTIVNDSKLLVIVPKSAIPVIEAILSTSRRNCIISIATVYKVSDKLNVEKQQNIFFISV